MIRMYTSIVFVTLSHGSWDSNCVIRMYTSIVFVTLSHGSWDSNCVIRMYTSIVFVTLFRTAVRTVVTARYVCTLVAAQWRSGHCFNINFFVCSGGGPRHLGLPG